MAWYENVSLIADSVHDVKCEKGENVGDADVHITFNPKDWTKTVVREDINSYNEDNNYEDTSTSTMMLARADLVDLFQMKEYDMVGITQEYHLAERVSVLDDDSYLFALLLDSNYTISMVKDDVILKISQFNNDAMISVEFNPSGLASIIENEVTGVNVCRIVQQSGSSYSEITEPISMDDFEVYQVNLDNIDSRIVALRFNIDIEIDED